nr:hypothetical protein [Tanacetum cinerariifolium]
FYFLSLEQTMFHIMFFDQPRPPEGGFVIDNNHLRMIAEMDQDVVVVLEDDKEKDREVADAVKDVKEAKADESAQD